MIRRGAEPEDAALRLNATGRNYFLWLLAKIHISEHDENRLLMEILFERRFYWSVSNDDNRAQEGLDLRDEFERETGWPISEYKEVGLNIPCSVLEMLVGLARAIEDNVMYDPKYGDRTHIWFWEMIENLGLDKCTDSEIEWNDRFGVIFIDRTLENWLDRDFREDGFGSPFPLNKPETDQRNVEIWYQAMSFLDENYEF